jgi:peptidoglycan hydrolase CwlO-like protein
MTDAPGDGDQEGGDGQSTAMQLLGIALVVVTAAFLVFIGIEAFPHHVKNATNPNFVDNIVANSVAIFAIRLALFFAVVYVGVSVIGLIGGRRWLSQLGPFKASDEIARLDQGAEDLEKGLTAALGTINDLEQRLEDSDDALTQARSHIASLLDHIDMIEGQKEGK